MKERLWLLISKGALKVGGAFGAYKRVSEEKITSGSWGSKLATTGVFGSLCTQCRRDRDI
jgi:hypothetical protein